GAENDLKRATQITRRMVAHWGMSEKVGPVAYQTGEDNPFLGKEIVEQREFSEHSAQIIDQEVSRILHEADDKARRMIHEHRASLDKLAHALIDEETIDDLQIEKMIGPSVNRRKRSIDADAETKPAAGAGITEANDAFQRTAAR
ncbi:MAG TPA: cell division protein FtsH, partial [Pirellulales bacterium]